MQRPHDALIACGMILLSTLVIFGLRVIAKDAPSSERSVVVGLPTPNITAAQGCQNFADFWMNADGVGATAEQIEGITNCRRANDGSWIVPTGSRDPRITITPILSPDQRTATSDLRAELLDELNDLDDTIPNSLRTWLSQIYDPFPRPVFGHIRDGISIRTQRNRYTRLAQAYLIDPRNDALASYVGWVMGRRIGSYDAMKDVCLNDPDVAYLRTACLGLEDNLSIRSIPFPWDLRNSFLLDTYLASLDPDQLTPRAATRETGPE